MMRRDPEFRLAADRSLARLYRSGEIGPPFQPPRIVPARRPPLWETAAAEHPRKDPPWDSSAQPGPEVEFDQRIAW